MSTICCANPSSVRRLADALSIGLRVELDLTPKPGLVDRWDSGSHDDLNYRLMVHSITLLERYFKDCALALERGCPIEMLRELGILAEHRMWQTLGANTHRGAIFLGGLLLGAAHTAGSTETDVVSDAVAEIAHCLFASRLPSHTKGARVRAHYGVGGIVREALDGLPALFVVGVPTLREATRLGFAEREALFLAMARLMQTVEDTTALRRCGRSGLKQLRQDGRSLESLLLIGADPTSFLIQTNQRYRDRHLTMGGIADLLGLAVAWTVLESLSSF